MSKKRELLWLVGILCLAAYLRIANIVDNPGWFSDEGTQLEIARHWLDGRQQYLAITQSVLLFSRLPLFTAVLALAAKLGGVTMVTLRLLTGSLGVLSVSLLYVVVRSISRDGLLALLAAWLLAFYPQAVLYSRFGFSYNLLPPLVLGMVWGLWRWSELPDGSTGARYTWLAIAATCLGLGMVSDLLMIAFLPVFGLWVGWHRWPALGWSLLLALLPFAMFVTVSLLSAPSAFWFDLNFVFFRLGPPLAAQLRLLVDNLSMLGRGAWLAWGVVGMLLLRPSSFRHLLLLCLLPLLVLGRTAALFNLGAYYLIPFLPFFALGVAALARYGPLSLWTFCGRVQRIMAARGLGNQKWRPPSASQFLSAGLVAALFCLHGVPFMQQTRGGYQTEIDPFLLNPALARATAVFVNQCIQPDDVVIASPGLAWLLTGHVADFQMAVAVQGVGTPHLPADVPLQRFAFDPDYQQARFVIIDNLWHNWAAANVPGVAAMMQTVALWPLVYEAGDIRVYQNPDEIKSPAHCAHSTHSSQ